MERSFEYATLMKKFKILSIRARTKSSVLMGSARTFAHVVSCRRILSCSAGRVGSKKEIRSRERIQALEKENAPTRGHRDTANEDVDLVKRESGFGFHKFGRDQTRGRKTMSKSRGKETCNAKYKFEFRQCPGEHQQDYEMRNILEGLLCKRHITPSPIFTSLA